MARKLKKIALLVTVLASACGHNISGDLSNSASQIIQNPNGEGIDYTNVVSNPSEMRSGDILYVDYDSAGKATLDFSGVVADAGFVLIAGNAGTADETQSVKAMGDLVVWEEAPAANEENETALQENFDLQMREREVKLALAADFVEPSLSNTKAMLATSSGVGSQKSFRVLNSLTTANSYAEVKATAECVGSEVVFYVDDRVSSSVLSSDDVQSLCNRFDVVAGEEQELFGPVSDINSDGKVAVLMTPQVNMLGGLGGGIITGFFNASDLSKRSSANAVSNEQEILFIMVPDSDGKYGVSVSKDFAMDNLLPSVLPHELQHAISYNMHVLMNHSRSEEAWLNEGLSHLAEDLMGHGRENASRYGIYLQNPSSYSLVTASSPGLATRGAAYLFLRYLYEQHANGSKFVRNLLNTMDTGVVNVEQAFGGSDKSFDGFGEFFMQWQVALTLSNTGLTKDSRFNYRDRAKHPVTGEWMGVCLVCSADDGRGTVLRGVVSTTFYGSSTHGLKGTSSRFLQLAETPESLSLSTGSDQSVFGVLIRTR